MPIWAGLLRSSLMSITTGSRFNRESRDHAESKSGAGQIAEDAQFQIWGEIVLKVRRIGSTYLIRTCNLKFPGFWALW